jgi:UDP-4-amino-4,6-dideoxy-N-acetyl-beta-L-altrosamine N-acetyltransferase
MRYYKKKDKIIMFLKEFELINFIDLSDSKKEIVLRWRNHKEIKKWMYNSNNITILEHLNFINNLKKDQTKRYFLVKKREDYIGVIDFTNINYTNLECKFGFYVNPFLGVSGIGTALLKLAIEYVFSILKLKRIKLEVLRENKKAIHLYKKFNFKEICVKKVDNKDVICMELLYEDR